MKVLDFVKSGGVQVPFACGVRRLKVPMTIGGDTPKANGTDCTKDIIPVLSIVKIGPTNVYGRQNYLRDVAGRPLTLRNRLGSHLARGITIHQAVHYPETDSPNE